MWRKGFEFFVGERRRTGVDRRRRRKEKEKRGLLK